MVRRAWVRPTRRSTPALDPKAPRGTIPIASFRPLRRTARLPATRAIRAAVGGVFGELAPFRNRFVAALHGVHVPDTAAPASMTPMALATNGVASPTPVEAPETVVGSRVLARVARDVQYRVRMADSPADVIAAQKLRFEVFNLERHEGLESSYATQRDEDPFDAHCDHLVVESAATGGIVGTYRLQTGRMAQRNLGYYSAQEFQFAPFEPVRDELVELGRACVHRSHRNLRVLSLLWRGVVEYARRHDCRYFVGCSSMPGQDAAAGAAAYLQLGSHYLVDAAYRTHPLPAYVCALDVVAPEVPRVPPLLRAYFSLGARICGAPALDREFKTIDFLTWMDLATLPQSARHLLEG
jgi:putative hemolysin